MPRRKALKVIVDVHLHAITCPGVFLPAQQDVFINVEMFGQRKTTKSAPPVFPFLFHEKLRFDKVFTHATDPVHISSGLDGETIRVEMVQLTLASGELLATYEDNGRDFLFPPPRVTTTYPGVDREVLLQRSAAFPGIAPKLEFSTRTVIKEVTSVGRSVHSSRKVKGKRASSENHLDLYRPASSSYSNPYNHVPEGISATTVSSVKRKSSLKKKTKFDSTSNRKSSRRKPRASSLSRASTQWGYEQPTIASHARSPSPYTKRRMAQLSISDSFESSAKSRPFKTDLEERPEFVVRKASRDSLSYEKTPLPLPPVPLEKRSSSRSRERISSPSRRKRTPGRPKRMSSTHREYDTDENAASRSAEEYHYVVDPSYVRRVHPHTRYKALRSAYYRPITSNCYLNDPRSEPSNQDLKLYLSDREAKELYCRYSRSEEPSARPSSVSSNYSISMSGSHGVGRSPSHVTFKDTTYLIENSGSRHRRGRSPSRPRSSRSSSRSPPRPRSSRSDSRSPRPLSDRSDSRSPSRPRSGRISSRSPTRHLSGRSTSRSPSRPRSGRISSRSPTRPRSGRSTSRSASVTPRRDSSLSRGDLEDDIPTRSSKLTPSSILYRPTLRERFTTSSRSPYDKIRDRVRDLLRSPSANQIVDDSVAEASELYWRRKSSKSPSPRTTPRSTLNVNLNNDEYWNERVSELTGKPHRRIFEDSVDKIYDDIYDRIRHENT